MPPRMDEESEPDEDGRQNDGEDQAARSGRGKAEEITVQERKQIVGRLAHSGRKRKRLKISLVGDA